MPAEGESRSCKSVDGCSTVAITTMDGHFTRDAHRLPSAHYTEDSSARTPIIRGGAPDYAPHTTDGLLNFRGHLRERGVSEAGTAIVLASWKPGTQRQYQPHIKRWMQFCDKWHISPYTPTVSSIINFLAETFNRNVGYETVNTARSALSSLGIVVDGCRAGNHPLVLRFMKGVFNLQPPLPRYTEIWDVQPVLRKLKSMYQLQTLTLKDLTLKLVMLMALTQAARVQTLQLLVKNGIRIKQDSISVQLKGNVKQCRPTFNVRSIKFHAYSRDTSLCVCVTLQHYLARTEELSKELSQSDEGLLLSYIRPYNSVTKDTIARWLKVMLRRSGVDTTKFTAGSVRSAATSKAKAMSVPIASIMSKAGWTQESTFAKFYDKHIVSEVDPFQRSGPVSGGRACVATVSNV